jgi:hypothetical protein
MAIIREFPNNVIMNTLMKVDMAKMSPKVDELREVVDGKKRHPTLSYLPMRPNGWLQKPTNSFL